MATGSPGTNGVWQYGEDDSESTFSALLNKVASTTDTQIGADRTRLTDLEARSLAGMVLVKSQAIGTGVSSVTVTNAFSTTYDNYKIIYQNGTGSTDLYIRLQLGATTTGYYTSAVGAAYSDGSTSTATDNNQSLWRYAGAASTSLAALNLEIFSPFLTTRTQISGFHHFALGVSRLYAGILNNATSYTDFTISTSTGTLTGGTIYVYGMKK